MINDAERKMRKWMRKNVADYAAYDGVNMTALGEDCIALVFEYAEATDELYDLAFEVAYEISEEYESNQNT
jgi:hypothetical protein